MHKGGGGAFSATTTFAAGVHWGLVQNQVNQTYFLTVIIANRHEKW